MSCLRVYGIGRLRSIKLLLLLSKLETPPRIIQVMIGMDGRWWFRWGLNLDLRRSCSYQMGPRLTGISGEWFLLKFLILKVSLVVEFLLRTHPANSRTRDLNSEKGDSVRRLPAASALCSQNLE